MTHLTDRQGKPIEETEARSALLAALRSSRFASSPQLSDFLRYIVEETLAGRAGDIKAYSIAVDALGKGEDFDPQDNAAVRVAAGRLRRGLALHNAENTTNNPPLVITVEAGSYVPVFVSATTDVSLIGSDVAQDTDNVTDVAELVVAPMAIEAAPIVAPAAEVIEVPDDQGGGRAASNRPTGFHIPTLAAALIVALLVSLATASFFLWKNLGQQTIVAEAPFVEPPKSTDRQLRPGIAATFLLPEKTYPDWFDSGEVADAIAVNLAHFDSYEFYGVAVASDFPASGNHHADYLLLVSAYNNINSVRIYAQLLRGRDGVVLWSIQRLFPPPSVGQDYDTPQIVGRLLAPLLSPYGVVFNDLRNGGADRFGLRCFIIAYRYFYDESDERHAAARECAEDLQAKDTRLPSVFAALTFLYLDEYRENRNRRDRDPLEAAEKAAARAVQLGPLSARAHQAQFAVHKVRGHREMARRSGQRAVELNSYDTDILGDYAAWLISIGDTENGKPLLDQAVSLLQSRPAWVDFYRFLGSELSRDLDGAAEISAMLDIKRSPLLAAAVAIGAHRRGETGKTERALQELWKTDPGMARDPMASFTRRGFDESVAQLLADKLDKAGLRNASMVGN